MHQDWNAHYYAAYRQATYLSLSAGSQEHLDALERVVQIAHDFSVFASKYGELIISELPLPNDRRTIPALDNETGRWGSAGGAKYVYHGIFFKFALDWKGIYGSDEAAAKAANAELRALTELQLAEQENRCLSDLLDHEKESEPLVDPKQIHFPMMCLLDYHGYRLIACMFEKIIYLFIYLFIIYYLLFILIIFFIFYLIFIYFNFFVSINFTD